MDTLRSPIALVRPAERYCGHTVERPEVPWEIALSRIWEALKLAERQRSRPNTDRASEPAADDPDRRAGLRHTHNVSLLIYGLDADKQPFHEEAETIDAHEKGCSLSLETVVVRGQRLFLTNMRTQAEQECRVIHVGRRIRGKSRVGIEFVAPTPEFWRPA
jgi:hypothetical protein